MEADEEPLYFDARQDRESWWASPVQSYLDLMAGDKRDREIAQQVKAAILGGLARNPNTP